MTSGKLPFRRRNGNHSPSPKQPGADAGSDVTADFLGGPALPPDSPKPPAPPASKPPMSVAALVAQVKRALMGAFPQRVVVVGEISNLKMHTSGHVYFRLKDSVAAIDAAMFRSAASKLKFRPTDGLEVVAEGRVDVYEARGQLQFYVECMTPKGAGSLELAFRQLCQKLEAEGLFDPAHKLPLKRFPRAIGLVTSPTGAAIRDISRTLRRRWPAADVFLVPALVQGDGAAQSVARALRLLDANADRYNIDTIIVARGGGSLEDLWAFNEEVVARAIYDCRTPVISGVGHEVDVTISDMVADVRAATPTAAAEIAVPNRDEIRRHVNVLAGRSTRCVNDRLQSCRNALKSVLRTVVFRDPRWRLRSSNQRLDELSHRLPSALRHTIITNRRRLEPLIHSLAALHPMRLKERASAAVDAVLARLRWALGGQSKRAGDKLLAVQARLGAAHPRNRLALEMQKVQALGRQLEALSYRGVLKRGFSVTKTADGRIIRSTGEVKTGQVLQTELADGTIKSVADGTVAPPRPARKKPKEDEGPSLF